MKYVFIEQHRAEFSIKSICRVFRVARSGWYAWRNRRAVTGARQQFRRTCDEAVRKAFGDAKQCHGAPRIADDLPEYNVKTIAARGCGRKPHGSSVRSATVYMSCRYRRIC